MGGVISVLRIFSKRMNNLKRKQSGISRERGKKTAGDVPCSKAAVELEEKTFLRLTSLSARDAQLRRKPLSDQNSRESPNERMDRLLLESTQLLGKASELLGTAPAPQPHHLPRSLRVHPPRVRASQPNATRSDARKKIRSAPDGVQEK